jgi:hypothetical protein
VRARSRRIEVDEVAVERPVAGTERFVSKLSKSSVPSSVARQVPRAKRIGVDHAAGLAAFTVGLSSMSSSGARPARVAIGDGRVGVSRGCGWMNATRARTTFSDNAIPPPPMRDPRLLVLKQTEL